MKFPPPSPTYPYLSPTLQNPTFLPPTPTFYWGVGVGVGKVRNAPTFPHLAIFTGWLVAGSAGFHANHNPPLSCLAVSKAENCSGALSPSTTLFLCRDLFRSTRILPR